MSGTRFWIVVFAILALCGGGFVYQTRHGDYDAASAALVADQERLGEMQVLLAEEIPLTRAYRVLAARYMTHEPPSDRIESAFTRIVADVARRHRVRFLEASFKQPLAAQPAPSSPPAQGAGAPAAGSRLLPDGQARFIVSDVDDVGDPSIGRPDIDGSLFARIPLTLRLQGEWRPLVATIQDLSTHDVSMALKNPSIEAERSGVQLTLDAELLAPEITAVPGVLVEPHDRGRGTLTHRPSRLTHLARAARPPRRVAVATHRPAGVGRPTTAASRVADVTTARHAAPHAERIASTGRTAQHTTLERSVTHGTRKATRLARHLASTPELASKPLTTRDYVTTPDELVRPIDAAPADASSREPGDSAAPESPPGAASSASSPAPDEPEGP